MVSSDIKITPQMIKDYLKVQDVRSVRSLPLHQSPLSDDEKHNFDEVLRWLKLKSESDTAVSGSYNKYGGCW